MTEQTASQGGLDVLVVCRANRGRSPAVAELLRQYAVTEDIHPSPRIASSGLEAEPGLPMLPSMQRALSSRNVDAPTHLSRRFRLDEAARARLVITFDPEGRRTVVAQQTALVPRTFTLRELVRLIRSPHWRADWCGEPDVAARLHGLRPLVEAGDDDTPDPAGMSRWRARRLLDDLIDDVRTVAPAVLGSRLHHNDAAWRP